MKTERIMKKLSYVMVFLLIAFVAQAATGIVSVSWKQYAGAINDPTEPYGVASAIKWTNLQQVASATDLVMDGGAVSTIDLINTAPGGYATVAAGGVYDNTPMRAGIAVFAADTTITLSDIGATFDLGAGYDIIVYGFGNNGAGGGNQGSFSDATTTYYMQRPNPASSTLVQSTDTSPGDGVDEGQYVRFNGLTGDTATITVSTVNANTGIGGIQIVGETVLPPPEPLPRPNVVMIHMDDLGWSDIAAYRLYQHNVMGHDLSTPYGVTPIPTPNMDRLCADGMMFTDAHSPAGLCAPTRFSMMTGSNPIRNGRHHGTWNWEKIPSAFEAGGQHHVTVGEIARAGGYRTSVFGKMHFGGGDMNLLYEAQPAFPSILGFDYSFVVPNGIQQHPYLYFENDRFVKIDPASPLFPSVFGTNADTTWWTGGHYPFGSVPGTVVGINGMSVIQSGTLFDGIGDKNWDTAQNSIVNTNKVVAFIDDALTNHADQPFLVYFNVPQPHAPQSPPIDFEPNADGSPGNPVNVPVAGTTVGNRHSDIIKTIDMQVGKILDKLEDPDGDGDTSDSVLAETLVYLSSDNGGLPNDPVTHPDQASPAWYDSTGAAAEFKGDPKEGGHRVPFIAVWPGMIEAGSVSDQLIISHDWVATMYALCELSMAPGQAQDAANLLPILLGDDPDTPIRDFAHHQGHTGDDSIAWQPNCWAMRQDIGAAQYTLIMDRTDAREPTDLYNLVTDFGQENNLINDPAYADIVDDMHTLYLAHNSQTDPRTTKAYIAPSTDVDPPTPNPATFAVAPEALSETVITMTATEGTDASGIVWYKFKETSGNSGGSTSNWQLGPEYTDDGLLSGNEYTYTVRMTDGLLNEGTPSAPATARTAGLPLTNWVGIEKIYGYEIPAWLDNSGTFIKASNLYGAASVTVGGVTFDSDTSNLENWGDPATKAYYSGPNADLATLLNNQGSRWGGNPAEVNITGLTPGGQYRMQMIVGGAWNYIGPMKLIGPSGETILLGQNQNEEGIHVAELVFVAPSADITFKAVSAWGNTVHVMAYSLYSSNQWVTYENLPAEDVVEYWLDSSGGAVKASNLYGALSVTVGGIDFDSDTSNLANFGSASRTYYSGDLDLETLLNNQGSRWSGYGSPVAEINFTGLIPGEEYRIQVITGEPWQGGTKLIGPAPDSFECTLKSGITGAINVASLVFVPETPDVKFEVKGTWEQTAHVMAYSLRSARLALPVNVDIKPAGCPNPVNLDSQGKTPVAIVGTEDFDVTTIDPNSIFFLEGTTLLQPVDALLRDETAPAIDGECACTEAGPDGIMDLVVYFETQELAAMLGEVSSGDTLELALYGYLYEGQLIKGTDCIVVKKRNAKKPPK